MAPTTEKEKKSKLGRLFGSGGETKKDQHISQDSTRSNNLRPSGESVHDSAYASSENANRSGAGSADNIVHVDNKGQIDGVDRDRNLGYNKSTGDVFDEDTGETVVTTTTTTTTTTTHRPGGKNQLRTEVKTDGGQPIAMAATGADHRMSELPAATSPVPPGRTNDSPPVPVRSDRRRRSMERNENPVSPQITQASPHNQPFSPPPVVGNGTAPGSPARTNFSYPSRAEPPPGQHPMAGGPGVPPAEHQPGHRGTMSNLKAAAVGIHGVGETLRGTLNNEADSRMRRSNPQKAAAADAKNQAALDKGRTEMAGLRARNGLTPSVSNQQQSPSPPGQHGTFAPNFNGPPNQSNIHPAQRDQSLADSLSYTNSHDNRPPQADYGYYGDNKSPMPGQPIQNQHQQSPPGARPQPNEYGVSYPQTQNHPGTTFGGPAGGGMPPETHGPYKEVQPHQDEKKSGLGKLFKRKPVPPGQS